MIQKFFDKAAKTYDTVSFLQRAVCEALIDRLTFFQPEKGILLDIGCGTGLGAKAIAERYQSLYVVGFDVAFKMLTESKHKISLNGVDFICANAHLLPFRENSADFVFSNMSLQWCENLPLVFHETLKILKTGGTFLFSTVGPDTLKELRASWLKVDPHYSHVNSFMDMHDVGDLLLRAGFLDPVLDRELLCTTYHSVYELLKDLKTLGSSKLDKKIYPGLTTRKSLAALADHYERYRTPEGILPVTYEIIFGVGKKCGVHF